MTEASDSVLVVRRSIHIKATPEKVWQQFQSFERMNRWWGAVIKTPEAGKPDGQHLLKYEPRRGGWIEMGVMFDGTPLRYGGTILVFDPSHELTFESDWIPNQGWLHPTRMTLRLTAALSGTLVELTHHGFERTGPNAGEELAGYESG